MFLAERVGQGFLVELQFLQLLNEHGEHGFVALKMQLLLADQLRGSFARHARQLLRKLVVRHSAREFLVELLLLPRYRHEGRFHSNLQILFDLFHALAPLTVLLGVHQQSVQYFFSIGLPY